ncbi:uncharacterized protein ARMOST_22276 [Armillaria ostoyae]|uniref:Uncharacterized protein n=1 Tax=Armillaria ostoyae TaxID=47428 RepID=A0A284SCF4_ARMOS|nr:uncharacterized protein ARMOST_22276 [Armillaria ostoyae]
MAHADEKSGWPSAQPAYVSLNHEVDKMIVYKRAGLFFVFNFHTNMRKLPTSLLVLVDAGKAGHSANIGESEVSASFETVNKVARSPIIYTGVYISAGILTALVQSVFI